MTTAKLTEGNINKLIFTLAIPIIGSSFLQMTYGLIDMFWIGKLGSEAIAGIGTASFILQVTYAINAFAITGTGIKVSHCIGRHQFDKAKEYMATGKLFNTILALSCIIVIGLFSKQMIRYFNLGNTVSSYALSYLQISMIGLFFKFQNLLYTRILHSYGDSKLPFQINLLGVGLNIILDPIFIFTLNLGISGAAIATVIAEIVVTLLLYTTSKKYLSTYNAKPTKHDLREILKLGSPLAIQRIIFTIFGIFIAKIVAYWGSDAIAAQRIVLQIDSIAFITIGGFHSAVSSFIGQNYGAQKFTRLLLGYKSAFLTATIFGLITTLCFYNFAEPLSRIFTESPATIKIATEFLKILSISQIFMCVEIIANGVFAGIGALRIAATISVVFTGLRIPLALYLSHYMALGTNGIWLAITITSVIRGILATMICTRRLKCIQSQGVIV